MPRGNCTLFHYSRCAGETAAREGHTSTASALAVQKERDPPEVWNVAGERSKRSKSSEGLGEVQIVGVPVTCVSLLEQQKLRPKRSKVQLTYGAVKTRTLSTTVLENVLDTDICAGKLFTSRFL
jgi:hypothetical protein